MAISKIRRGSHKGEFRIRIQPVDPTTGKRVPIPIEFADSKNEAKQKEQAMWDDYRANLHLGASDAVFADSFQSYVNKRAETISPVTLKAWQDSANAFRAYFGKAKVKDITTALVSQYAHNYVDKHHATVSKSSTIGKRLIHMRNFFHSIEGKGVDKNPVPEAPLKVFFRQSQFSIGKDWYIFTDRQLDSIRKLIEADLATSPILNWGSKLAILIETYTGMRVGELQALKFSNIVFENAEWSFRIDNSWSDYFRGFNGSLKARPKGYSRLVLPVPEKVINLLKRYKSKQKAFLKEHDLATSSDLILINLHDYKKNNFKEPIKQKSLNDMLKAICKRLNIKSNGKRLSMYSFRHTLCTKLANTPGMSYPWAAQRMGHSLNMFMNTYVGVNSDVNRRMTKLWVS